MDLCWMAPDDYYWDDLEVQVVDLSLSKYHQQFLL